VTSPNEKQNERRRKRYAEDPEYRETELARKRAHYRLHKNAITAGIRVRYATDPEFRLKRKLKNTYGMSPEDYARLLAGQGGVCAICQRPPSEARLCVDHCHATGQIRGLLCRSCNGALGFLRDDENVAMAAAAYLRKAKAS
jgi:Recombination endonuclease VII